MITVINYGSGNISAIETALQAAKCEYEVTADRTRISNARKLLLPGVGAFDPTMAHLRDLGLDNAIRSAVIDGGAYCFGICVGMHILASSSEEGELPGLGLIPGHVAKFEFLKDTRMSLPHIGWNTVNKEQGGAKKTLFDSASESEYYFLHSYYFKPNEAANSLFISENGHSFASAVCTDRVYGFQFHPEKSHDAGIEIFRIMGAI